MVKSSTGGSGMSGIESVRSPEIQSSVSLFITEQYWTLQGYQTVPHAYSVQPDTTVAITHVYIQ